MFVSVGFRVRLGDIHSIIDQCVGLTWENHQPASRTQPVRNRNEHRTAASGWRSTEILFLTIFLSSMSVDLRS